MFSTIPLVVLLLTTSINSHILSSADLHYTHHSSVEKSEHSIQDMLTSDLPSVLLLYSHTDETNTTLLLKEFEKLNELVGFSGLELSIGQHYIPDTDASSILQRFKTKQLPSIKLILDGSAFEYAGKRTATSIFQHLKEKALTSVLRMSNATKLSELINSQQQLLVYFGADASSTDSADTQRVVKIKRIYNTLKSQWDDYFLFIIAQGIQTIPHHEGLPISNGDIILFRKHSPFILRYEGEQSMQEISAFLQENFMRKIVEVDRKFIDSLRKRKDRCMLLVVKKGDNKAFEDYISLESEVSGDLRLAIHWENEDKSLENVVRDLVGSGVEFPKSQVFILDYTAGTFRYYRMDFEMTQANILSFFSYWKQGVLNYLLRTEKLPTRVDSNIQKIVGRNFASKVMEPSYDAYVVFHFRGCGEPCERLIQMVGRVASELRRYKILQFYHIDLTLNDIPDLNLIYIPAFGVFKGNSKEPIIYQDEKISERRILDFVTETTELLSPQEYANLKKEIEVMQFDELMSSRQNQKVPEPADYEL